MTYPCTICDGQGWVENSSTLAPERCDECDGFGTISCPHPEFYDRGECCEECPDLALEKGR